MKRPELLATIGDLMFTMGRDLFPRGSVEDVYAWEDGNNVSFAWRMPPQKLRSIVGPTGEMRISGRYVTTVLRRHGFAYDAFSYEPELDVNTFLQRFGQALLEKVEDRSDVDMVHVTFIPVPGYPWPHHFYSATRGEFMHRGKPAWLLRHNVVDTALHIDSPGVDFCELIGPLRDYSLGATVAAFGRGDHFIVTHSMGRMSYETPDWKDMAEKVRSCGGLLFPSLAVAPTPATSFGPFVLVADAGIVLRSLAPLLNKKQWLPARVYNTDVWTMTTGDFVRGAAVAAFEQLTGQSDWIYYLDMNVWPLGAPQSPELHGPGVGDALTKTSQLTKELRQRMSIYPRGISPEDMEKRHDRYGETKHRYPYLEAKANGVMRIADFPLAVAPKGREAAFKSFLTGLGFKGRLLTVDLPSEIAEVMDPGWSPPRVPWERKAAIRRWAEMEYGWQVSDAIVRADSVYQI